MEKQSTFDKATKRSKDILCSEHIQPLKPTIIFSSEHVCPELQSNLSKTDFLQLLKDFGFVKDDVLNRVYCFFEDGYNQIKEFSFMIRHENVIYFSNYAFAISSEQDMVSFYEFLRQYTIKNTAANVNQNTMIFDLDHTIFFHGCNSSDDQFAHIFKKGEFLKTATIYDMEYLIMILNEEIFGCENL